MKKLKYLLFFLIIFLAPTTFADEFNMNSYTSASKGGTKNRYRATEIYNIGASNTYTFGTQYSGRLSDIETYFSYPFSANMTYTLTYNMNTDDFRNRFGSSYWWDCDQEMTNTNATVVSVNYISYRKVKFTFTTTDATSCIRVWLRSSNVSSTAITGDSNWRLNNITIYDPEWQNGSSSSSGSQGSSPGSSGSSSSNNTDEIINNATENTHTIVDNQNQNTQDIIDNNNNNTQTIIDDINKNQTFNSIQELNAQRKSANSSCKNYYDFPIEFGKKSLDNSGQEVDVSINNFYTPQYINIDTILRSYGNVLRVINPSQSISGYRIYFYDSSYNMLSYVNLATRSITIPTNAQFFKFVSPVSNTYIYRGNSCISSADETNEYLKDNSDPSISDSALNDVFGRVHFTDPLSYLLTLPTQLINKIVSLSDSCSSIDLGTLYGVHLTMPCINIQKYLGNDLWNIIDLILTVGLLSIIFKNFYDTVSNLLTLGGEKEAKEKFSMPTPMDFLAMILGGDNR